MGTKLTPEAEGLYQAILQLKTKDECRALFADLCTEREISEMARRLAVAVMLRSGRRYTEISSETGASSATISRVANCLNYGAGGYRDVLSRLEKDESDKDGDGV